MPRNYVKAIEELLTIAKVAMTDELFAIDPRIAHAQGLLDQLKRRNASVRRSIEAANSGTVERQASRERPQLVQVTDLPSAAPPRPRSHH